MSEIVPPILTCRTMTIFLCRTETLSVLLDYRSEDNKEGTFEVGFLNIFLKWVGITKI